RIAPGAKVLNVQVADGEHGGTFRCRPADVSPSLGPTIVSGSQKWERREPHLFVLEVQIVLGEPQPAAQPRLPPRGSFSKFHEGLRLTRCPMRSRLEQIGSDSTAFLGFRCYHTGLRTTPMPPLMYDTSSPDPSFQQVRARAHGKVLSALKKRREPFS